MTDNEARRLRDVLQAIARIRSFTPDTLGELEADERSQDAIVYRFLVIGEAVDSMSRELRDAHPDIPWGDIAGMRHIIVHDYDRVSLNIVWAAIHEHLPPLEAKANEILG
jgi:uncharacterized protein with HEPN domain